MIVQQSGHALGTKIVFTLNTADDSLARLVLLRLRNYLLHFENRLSRFLPHSDITALNRNSGEYVSIDAITEDFLRVSNRMQSWSGGWYDPFILPELQRAGYVYSLANKYNKLSTPDLRGYMAPHKNLRAKVSDKRARISRDTAFDSGGLGKGYALDKLADIVEASGIMDYWISLGGDIIAAGKDEKGSPWQINLELQKNMPIVQTGEGRWAIATSSVLKRNGKNWHHLINPHTAKPSRSTIQSVSVVAKTGVEADIAAKSLLLADTAADEWWGVHNLHSAYIQRANSAQRLA